MADINLESVDTKLRIFNTSLRLFALNGYENVSIRAIADAVGIKTASIYYHYKSKEEILEACYIFFLNHRHITRLDREGYEPVIREGTKQEVIKVLNYDFPQDILGNMVLCLVVIYSRIYNDDRAKEIYIDDIDCSMRYLIEFFSCGVEIGRFHDFNIPSVALIFLSSRLFCAQSVTIETDRPDNWFMASNGVFDDLLNLIPFKY